MRLRHFYHVYAEGAWARPVREHIEALVAAKFAGRITIGLVGPSADRDRARSRLALQFAALRHCRVDWIERDAGFEQVTLAALHAWARDTEEDTAVLYAHTKGAHDVTDWNATWRRSMTRRVVGNWRRCIRLLDDGYDAVGCHWLTPEKHHAPPVYVVPSPFYGGNFWWARSSYLRRLPPVAAERRHDAEKWIGLGQPRAYDLLPGWPSEELCRS